MEQLWANYEKIRMEKGLADAEIARKAGMTRQALHKLKTKGSPTVRTLMKLAKAMDSKPGAFFFGVDC